MPAPRSPLAAGLVLITLLVPGRARALEAPRLIDAPVRSVDAGRTVELVWSAPAGVVEELEILLSVDGGRTFPIRVSPSLDPGTTHWRWHVPNLSAADARLRVRALVGGRETPGEPTSPFRIVAAPGQPVERALVQEGGWWSGCQPARPPATPAPVSREPLLSDALDGVPPLSGPPDVALTLSCGPLLLLPAPSVATASGGRPVPRAVPLRN